MSEPENQTSTAEGQSELTAVVMRDLREIISEFDCKTDNETIGAMAMVIRDLRAGKTQKKSGAMVKVQESIGGLCDAADRMQSTLGDGEYRVIDVELSVWSPNGTRGCKSHDKRLKRGAGIKLDDISDYWDKLDA